MSDDGFDRQASETAYDMENTLKTTLGLQDGRIEVS